MYTTIRVPVWIRTCTSLGSPQKWESRDTPSALTTLIPRQPEADEAIYYTHCTQYTAYTSRSLSTGVDRANTGSWPGKMHTHSISKKRPLNVIVLATRQNIVGRWRNAICVIRKGFSQPICRSSPAVVSRKRSNTKLCIIRMVLGLERKSLFSYWKCIQPYTLLTNASNCSWSGTVTIALKLLFLKPIEKCRRIICVQ